MDFIRPDIRWMAWRIVASKVGFIADYVDGYLPAEAKDTVASTIGLNKCDQG